MLTTQARLSANGGRAIPTARANFLIAAVSGAIESELDRKFGFRSFSVLAPELQRGGGDSIFLSRFPVRGIERITVDGREVTDWINDPEALEVGRIQVPGGWPAKHGRCHPLTGRPIPVSVIPSIEVAYSGGYILPAFDGIEDAENNPDGLPADLPALVEEAVFNSVIALASGNQPGRALKREKTPGGWDQEWDVSRDQHPVLTRYSLGLIEQYRRVIL